MEFFPNDNKKTNYYRIIYKDNSAADNDDHRYSELEYNMIKGVEIDEEPDKQNQLGLKLKEILVRLAITDYVVTKDPRSIANLIFLDRSNVESQGTLHCRHCGMEFEDEMQLGNHLRIHYMI